MICNNILAYVAIGWLVVVGRVSAYFNQTYGDYSFILSDERAQFNKDLTSLTYTQEWCRSHGYALLTIPDRQVQQYAEQFLRSAMMVNGLLYTVDLFILNGKLHTGTWTWVNGQQINNVEIKDQRELSQRYFYGFLKTNDYKIYASTPNSTRPFICEKPGNANDCAGGSSFNGRCYQRKTSLLTWCSARNVCLDGGGDLASFETLTDSTFRSTLGSTLLANTPAAEYWVGLQRVEWRWEDTGLPIKYSNWESGSPSNDFECFSLRLTPVGAWLGYNCSESYRFICTATKQTTVVATSSTASTVISSSVKTTVSRISLSTPSSLSSSVSKAFTTSSIALTVMNDTSSVETVSGASLSTPSSLSSSVPSLAFTRSTSLSQSSTNGGLGVGQSVGVGIGIGLGVTVIVVVIIFVIRLTKRKQKDSERGASAVQQSSTFPSTVLTSDNSNTNSSATNITETYDTFISTDARSTENPYQQLNNYKALN